MMMNDSAPKRQQTVAADRDPDLKEVDALWLRRGQRLGEALLASRDYAAYGSSAALALIGGSLILLALVGGSEAPMMSTISAEADGLP